MHILEIESSFQPLYPLNEILDLVMAADKKKNNFIGKLKQDAILEPGSDFPIVGMPVLQTKTGG